MTPNPHATAAALRAARETLESLTLRWAAHEIDDTVFLRRHEALSRTIQALEAQVSEEPR